MPVISENWFEDSLNAVKELQPRNPGGYFRECLRENADKLGFDLEAELERVRPSRKQVRDLFAQQVPADWRQPCNS